uniref:PPM-type phosphatase domain-containing protein n=1 Tax=Rhabditophanes sp. KR3021 TaxID=114890 RepID=A0AC35TGY1_9BILA
MSGTLKDDAQTQSMVSFGEDEEEGQAVLRNFHVTACAIQGGRKYMEDRCQLDIMRANDGTLEYIFAGVFDGHGGDEASIYTRKYLLQNIKTQPGFLSENDNDFLQGIKDGYLKTHNEMLIDSHNWKKHSLGYNGTAGTTATVMFIRNSKVFVGHVGDSAIYSIKERTNSSLKTVQITKDHKPEDQVERERIMKAGGNVVTKGNCPRVVWQRTLSPVLNTSRPDRMTDIPFLAIARSLGDFWSYNPITHQYVVSPEPDVFRLPISALHRGFILCSDGVTNVINERKLSDLVEAFSYQNKKLYGPKCPDYTNYARVVVNQTIIEWGSIRSDNITAIAIMLDENVCLENEGPTVEESRMSESFSLDDELTIYPSDCIVIKARGQDRERTEAIDVGYFGKTDHDYEAVSTLIGPGFVVSEDYDGMMSDDSYMVPFRPALLDIKKNEKKEPMIVKKPPKIGHIQFHGFRKTKKIPKSPKKGKENEKKGLLHSIMSTFGRLRSDDKQGKDRKSELRQTASLTALNSQSQAAKETVTIGSVFSRSYENIFSSKPPELIVPVPIIHIPTEIKTPKPSETSSDTSKKRLGKRRYESNNGSDDNSSNEETPLDSEDQPPPKKRGIWDALSHFVSNLKQ